MSREMVVESGLWYISQGPAICDVGLRITLQRAISSGKMHSTQAKHWVTDSAKVSESFL